MIRRYLIRRLIDILLEIKVSILKDKNGSVGEFDAISQMKFRLEALLNKKP